MIENPSPCAASKTASPSTAFTVGTGGDSDAPTTPAGGRRASEISSADVVTLAPSGPSSTSTATGGPEGSNMTPVTFAAAWALAGCVVNRRTQEPTNEST